ncbi:carboxypeptidase regulatory-like domain-containing protein [Spirosoma utsteinense]|uniref:TonB-dependent receptor plug domain-containing protein n=1 Tax=Spirosoma utsteinense TaxID=2585773 RepID=A0ABR6VZ49_9BACT|nr:carboxypeptidase regulatory-like domain-containing protein [Spirosoma utsteinense]MBC3784685.1 hypothetical protein [Spirosoma utsteinense]MBC3789561.1 hypothetical protein [Spirosoma utsteinense]
MKTLLLITVCLLLVIVQGAVQAQTPSATLTGRVLDPKTGQVLPFASVYINNSTRGSTADENGIYRLTGLPLGTYELVGSMLGYTTTRQTLRLNEARTYTIDLDLKASGSDLAAVTVSARRSGAWQRQYRQFSRELLGNRPPARQTSIVNASVLRFSEEKGHLLARADEPLVIENNALGYRLHYTLLHFDLYRGRMDFAGDCRFEELKPANARQQATWQANRLKAYHSSLQHLLASLLTGTHEQEGFTVYRTPLLADGSPAAAQAMPLVRTVERQRLDAQQALALFQPGGAPFERHLMSAQPLEVYYNRVYTRNSPYNDSPYAYSMLLFPHQSISLTTNGWVTEGKGLDVRGYLGDDRLATLLPADWIPTNKQLLEPIDIAGGRTLRPDARLDSLLSYRQRQARHTAPLVFVHTDKALYSTGDVVWFSAYVVDALRQLPPEGLADQSLHVELLAPEGRLISHQWLQINDGRAVSQLRLSDTLLAGTYRLRAYTVMDQTPSGPAFETPLTVQNIRLPGRNDGSRREVAALAGGGAGIAMDSLDVQFLPEGGRWLAGVPARLGIRVVQPGGRGRAVSGRIVDGAGQDIARFSTNVLGLGQVRLTPQTGQRYVARLDESANAVVPPMALPEAEPEGWALSADALSDSARLLVTVHATGRYQQQPVYITLQSREQLVYRQKWQLTKGEAQFALPTGNLPPGVCRLTLWDTAGRARAERLVFVAEQRGPMQMRVVTAKIRYAPREQVAIGLQFRDQENYPIAAIWSAAVTDADQLPADTNQVDLRTHLLLTSGLGDGRIESPAHYLLAENGADLDLLLLTRGWRRLPAPTPADSTGGWALSGQVQDSRGRPLANETVTLQLENKGLKLLRSLTTDRGGRFRLSNLLLTDTVQVRARTPKTSSAVVRIDQPGGSFSAEALPAPDWGALVRWTADASVRQSEWPALYRDSTARQLAEVVVRATKYVDRDKRPVDVERASLHNEADGTLVVEGNNSTLNATNIWSLLEMVPGIGMLKRGPINGDNTPLYIIDGIYADGNVVDLLEPRMVSRIEILKNSTTAGIYGVRAAAGVIAIFTRKGKNVTLPEFTSPAVTLVGFVTPREYYVPRYELLQGGERIDRRDVLYWQPLGRSDLDGQARLNFPLSDTARRLRVVVQGLSTEGVPIYFTWVLPMR